MWTYSVRRFIYAGKDYPRRIRDLIMHVIFWENSHWYVYRYCRGSFWYIIVWLTDIFWLLLDLTMIPDIYEVITNLIKRSRPLEKAEQGIVWQVYGDLVPTQLVRKDPKSYFGPSWAPMAYVSFFTINFWKKPLSPELLVHETMHLIQYEAFGSRYINHALWAQYKADGYNYGGIDAIRKCDQSPYGIHAFNFEQMAEIMEDYYRLRKNYLSFSNPQKIEPIFAPFLDQLRKGIRNS